MGYIYNRNTYLNKLNEDNVTWKESAMGKTFNFLGDTIFKFFKWSVRTIDKNIKANILKNKAKERIKIYDTAIVNAEKKYNSSNAITQKPDDVTTDTEVTSSTSDVLTDTKPTDKQYVDIDESELKLYNSRLMSFNKSVLNRLLFIRASVLKNKEDNIEENFRNAIEYFKKEKNNIINILSNENYKKLILYKSNNNKKELSDSWDYVLNKIKEGIYLHKEKLYPYLKTEDFITYCTKFRNIINEITATPTVVEPKKVLTESIDYSQYINDDKFKNLATQYVNKSAIKILELEAELIYTTYNTNKDKNDYNYTDVSKGTVNQNLKTLWEKYKLQVDKKYQDIINVEQVIRDSKINKEDYESKNYKNMINDYSVLQSADLLDGFNTLNKTDIFTKSSDKLLVFCMKLLKAEKYKYFVATFIEYNNDTAWYKLVNVYDSKSTYFDSAKNTITFMNVLKNGEFYFSINTKNNIISEHVYFYTTKGNTLLDNVIVNDISIDEELKKPINHTKNMAFNVEYNGLFEVPSTKYDIFDLEGYKIDRNIKIDKSIKNLDIKIRKNINA